ncbi:MAG: hypothetical protein C4539_03780 [Ignavibacteriales bacterium]|nr:MAG: hypothetical protein C4539_03780 [Ignavibacteriales bacterium]
MILKNFLIKTILLPTMIFMFTGWGGTGHQLINKKCVDYFPKEFSWYSKWKNDLIEHASDADKRKSQYPDESIKHYIDIDNFSEFVSTGKINQSLDSMISNYGYNYVYDQGILPWVTISTYDSLVNTFKRKDWTKAVLLAADLGHYVGDGFMPLHVTANYNPGGIHYKFESELINIYSNDISFTLDTAEYISDYENSIFNYIYANNGYVDSIINANNYAKSYAGSTSGDAYFSTMWKQSKNFTTKLFNDAAKTLSALIYSAWVDAGKPVEYTTEVASDNSETNNFMLYDNFPNPFNPVTTIKFTLPNVETSYMTSLRIYNILGKEIITLINKELSPGIYDVELSTEGGSASGGDGNQLSSGVYFYSLNVQYEENGIEKYFTQTKKLILAK